MPDVQEVFRMATQKVGPDQGALERQHTRQRRRSVRRKIGPFTVAAAIVAVAVVMVMVGSRDPSPNEPAATATTDSAEREAEEVAQGFLWAIGNFDTDRAIAYLADDAAIGDLTGAQGGAEGLRLFTSLLEAQAYEQIVSSCFASGTNSSGIGVHCPFGFHLIGSDQLGLGPYIGSSFDLTVRDGEVASASVSWEIDRFSPEMWEPFAGWVSTTYPEDAAVMYTDDTLSAYRLSEESIRAWDRRTAEYAAAHRSEMVAIVESFMDARNTYDVEAALSLIADDGANVELLHNNYLYTEGEMPSLRLDRDELALALEAERLLDVRYGAGGCSVPEQGERADGGQLVCTFQMESRLRRIAGLGPGEVEFALGFENGRITHLSFPWLNVGFPGGSPADGARFVEWVVAEHPEAGGIFREGELFRVMGQEVVFKLTPDAIALLETYLDEYEAAEAG